MSTDRRHFQVVMNAGPHDIVRVDVMASYTAYDAAQTIVSSRYPDLKLLPGEQLSDGRWLFLSERRDGWRVRVFVTELRRQKG